MTFIRCKIFHNFAYTIYAYHYLYEYLKICQKITANKSNAFILRQWLSVEMKTDAAFCCCCFHRTSIQRAENLNRSCSKSIIIVTYYTHWMHAYVRTGYVIHGIYMEIYGKSNKFQLKVCCTRATRSL